MNTKKLIAVAFVDAINSQDIEALQTLFAAPCLLQKEHSLLDYQIQVERIMLDNDLVVLIGEAYNKEVRIPATWTAQICGSHVLDWQVYLSETPTSEN